MKKKSMPKLDKGVTSMKILNQCKLEFSSVPENVGLARVTVASFASQMNYNLTDLEEIKVAVSEAVANAILHGYDSDPGQVVRVSATILKDALEIRIEDTGKGIADLDQAMQPAYSSDPERMGLGFVFMKSFMDHLQVDTAPGQGTVITMVKSLGGKPAAQHNH